MSSLWQLSWLLLIFGGLGSTRPEKTLEDFFQRQLKFATDLYRRVNNQENVVIAPLSASAILGMTALGARDHTLTQLKKALYMSDFSHQEMNKFFNLTIQDITSVQQPLIKVANKMCLGTGYQIKPAFTNSLKNYYNANVTTAVFSRDANRVVADLNSWVDNQTEGHIKSILEPGSLDASTIFVQLNAMLFKGKWVKQFSKQQTTDGSFNLADGSNVTVPFMTTTNTYQYATKNKFNCTILRMNYEGSSSVDLGSNPNRETKFSMFVILPNSVESYSVLKRNFNADTFSSLTHNYVNNYRFRTVKVTMPKLKMSYKQDLKEALIAMGVTDVFASGRANLKGISDSEGLYLSKNTHVSNLEVDEEGTVGASATVGAGRRLGINTAPPPKVFKVDRPFIFVIYENTRKFILFIGNVDNPKT